MELYIGENIKRMRRERDLTQEKLAEELGVSFQTVSRWEKGDGFPDITMLPLISEFFETTVDDLLGIDKSKREQEVERYISIYDEMGLKDGASVLKKYEKAVKNFPYDYRILVRYMSLLIRENHTSDKASFEKVTEQIESIFNRINDHCGDDSIRIWAKSLMIEHLLFRYDCFGHDEKYRIQASVIINTMPALINSKEYLSTLISNGSKNDEIHKGPIEELLYLLQNVITSFCYTSDKFSAQYKIGVIKSINDLFGMVDSEDNYSKNRIHIIYNYGRLGRYYNEIGDKNNSIKFLKLAAETAVKFDAHENTETIYRYYESTGVFKEMNMSNRMKELMLNHYRFSEEFKASDEFKQVIALFGKGSDSDQYVF